VAVVALESALGVRMVSDLVYVSGVDLRFDQQDVLHVRGGFLVKIVKFIAVYGLLVVLESDLVVGELVAID